MPVITNKQALSWLLLLALVLSCLCQLQETERSCHVHDNSCSDCIRTPGCQWCKIFAGNSSEQHRCSNNSNNCREGQTSNPQNQLRITTNKSLTEVTQGDRNTEGEDIVQLAPQRVQLQLRKGVPHNVTFKFRLATHYPVDLYYLMDLSYSMLDDKENLANLGSKLASTMRNLTSKFKLGFGSFVDKVVMPFTNVHPGILRSPCPNCTSSYSFRNNLPLDVNDTKFTEYVSNVPVSGNVDEPEGGLDALLQVIVCRRQIGWREQARRLLVFSTDAPFHHAGNGRLAGIVQPHDGQCHLDDDGDYTHHDKLDYPSVAQINKAAQENQINIIFAVSAYKELYQALSEEIAYSSQGMLDSESSNVDELVIQQYNLISSEVRLSDNVASIPGSPLFVRYFTECLNKSSPIRQTRSCSGIKEGDEIEFVAQVEVLSVPSSEVRRDLQIQITTLQDTLTIDITVLAECECEQQGAEGREGNSTKCSGSGVMQCGICECYPGHSGAKCQCSTNNAGDPSDSASDGADCLADPAEPEQCSGEGVCQCGTCICNNRPAVTGKYCECNEDDCNNGAGSLCSGRGVCNCGVCRCQAGWAGKHCQCPEDENCFMPGESQPCSGKGECSCGRCSCHIIDSVLYSGKYCEECSTCTSGKCEELRDCVQCKGFRTGPLAGAICNETCTIKPKKLQSLKDKVRAGAKLCTFLDEKSGCDFNFTYKYLSSHRDHVVYVQKLQQCPPAPDVLLAVLCAIGAVVAIGTLTLILWKIFTTIHDRKEFEKFEKERNNVQWGTENSPLYKPATDTFVNPAFGNRFSGQSKQEETTAQ